MKYTGTLMITPRIIFRLCDQAVRIGNIKSFIIIQSIRKPLQRIRPVAIVAIGICNVLPIGRGNTSIPGVIDGLALLCTNVSYICVTLLVFANNFAFLLRGPGINNHYFQSIS